MRTHEGMSRAARLLALAVGLTSLMAGGAALAAESLTVSPLPAPLDFGNIVLASGSSASITVNESSGVVSVASGPAVLLPATKTISMPTVTVGCADAGGNGCKGNTHTITITPGANVQGRAITITALKITTPTLTSGGTVNIGSVSGNGTTSVSFNVASPSNGPQSWTVTFKVGMTYTISGASSPLQTQWKYAVANN